MPQTETFARFQEGKVLGSVSSNTSRNMQDNGALKGSGKTKSCIWSTLFFLKSESMSIKMLQKWKPCKIFLKGLLRDYLSWVDSEFQTMVSLFGSCFLERNHWLMLSASSRHQTASSINPCCGGYPLQSWAQISSPVSIFPIIVWELLATTDTCFHSEMPTMLTSHLACNCSQR